MQNQRPMFTGATPWSNTTILFTVCTANDGRWGADTSDEDARLIARNYAALAAAYAADRFPGATVEVSTSPDERRSLSLDADSDSEYEADDPEGHIYAITDYLSRHWTEEALWKPEFDAVAYLTDHPR